MVLTTVSAAIFPVNTPHSLWLGVGDSLCEMKTIIWSMIGDVLWQQAPPWQFSNLEFVFTQKLPHNVLSFEEIQNFGRCSHRNWKPLQSCIGLVPQGRAPRQNTLVHG